MLACYLVAVPLPLAVMLHLLLPLSIGVDEALFVAGVLAFAAGAFLLLGRDDEDSGFRRGDDLEPPWWPDFERGLRRCCCCCRFSGGASRGSYLMFPPSAPNAILITQTALRKVSPSAGNISPMIPISGTTGNGPPTRAAASGTVRLSTIAVTTTARTHPPRLRGQRPGNLWSNQSARTAAPIVRSRTKPFEPTATSKSGAARKYRTQSPTRGETRGLVGRAVLVHERHEPIPHALTIVVVGPILDQDALLLANAQQLSGQADRQ